MISPIVALNTPTDASTVVTLTPELKFTGMDADGDAITYEVQVDTNSTFPTVVHETGGATSARINANGELEMVDLPSATGEELTYDNLIEYDFSDEYGAINTVVASRQPQNDDVVMQDDAQVNLAMTRNLLDLETAQVTYTMEEA